MTNLEENNYTLCLGSREGLRVLDKWGYLHSEVRVVIRNVKFEVGFLPS